MPTPAPAKKVLYILKWLIGLAAFLQTSLSGAIEPETPLAELEAFKVDESRPLPDTLSPLARPVRGLFGEDGTAADLPRSLSILTPEMFRQFDLQNYSDLDKTGAGLQRIDYYGLAGSPFIRGAEAGTYFNGLMRVHQRNEMPMSFGSFEQIDIVKGPAPAAFSPTLAGGFVNQIPKQPYFDRPHGELAVSLGSWNLRRAQLDGGGPFLLGNWPAAWRVSLTGQTADSQAQRVGNDYYSLYTAVKLRPRAGLTVFTGGEYYDYRSSENAGWNRPTQTLIDQGRYVIGESPRLVSPEWGGTAHRTLLEFPYTLYVNPRLHSLAIPGPVARAAIEPSLLGKMIDLNDPAQVTALYSLQPDERIPHASDPNGLALFNQRKETVRKALDSIGQPLQDAYVYTPEYFAAGGAALTSQIGPETVLADERDYAQAQNGLYFFDLEDRRASARSWRLQGLAEAIRTSKLSSYGYGIATRQWAADSVLTIKEKELPAWLALSYGIEGRYSFAKTLQDFFAEPLSRRDLTQPEISANSTLRAGPQLDPNGVNLWSPQIGANLRSHLWQAGAFADCIWRPHRGWSVTFSGRGEMAGYRTGLPDEVGRGTPALAAKLRQEGRKNYYSVAVQPMVRVVDGLNWFGVVQDGTALDPSVGGVIAGKGNFAPVRLYETGLKWMALDGRLFSTVAIYHWHQNRFNDIDLEAEPLRSRGLEWELFWQVLERLSLTASFTAQRTWLRSGTVGFGAVSFDEQDWALSGGILNGQSNRRFASNPDLVYPGLPETSAQLFAVWQSPGGWGLSGGPAWKSAFWGNFDRTLRLPPVLLWTANLFYRWKNYEVFLTGQNLTDERYFLGSEPVFSSNTILRPGAGRSFKITLRAEF